MWCALRSHNCLPKREHWFIPSTSSRVAKQRTAAKRKVSSVSHKGKFTLRVVHKFVSQGCASMTPFEESISSRYHSLFFDNVWRVMLSQYSRPPHEGIPLIQLNKKKMTATEQENNRYVPFGSYVEEAKGKESASGAPQRRQGASKKKIHKRQRDEDEARRSPHEAVGEEGKRTPR